MMKFQLMVISMLFSTAIIVQTTLPGGLNYQFKPTEDRPFYTSKITKADNGWLRQCYFYPGSWEIQWRALKCNK